MNTGNSSWFLVGTVDAEHPAASEKFAIGYTRPLIPAFISKKNKDRNSLVQADNANIVITSVKPAYERNGIIVKLHNASDYAESFSLNTTGETTNIYICTPAGKEIDQISFPREIKARGLEIIRIDWKNSTT
jgi:alpha-mannosidase